MTPTPFAIGTSRDAGDKGRFLRSLFADPDRIGVTRHTGVTNINVVASGREIDRQHYPRRCY